MGINQQLRKVDPKSTGMSDQNAEKLDIETFLSSGGKKSSQMKVSECSYKTYKCFDLNMNQIPHISHSPTACPAQFYNEANR